MTHWPELSTPRGARQRYLNLCGALRSALLALRRQATAEEWTEFVSTGGQAEYDAGALKRVKDELTKMLKEVEANQ